MVFDNNTFTKVYRGGDSQVIIVNHVPHVTINGTTILHASGLNHFDTSSTELLGEYEKAFGSTNYFHTIGNLAHGGPESLIKVSQGVWVTIGSFNSSYNLMSTSTTPAFGLITFYEPQ